MYHIVLKFSLNFYFSLIQKVTGVMFKNCIRKKNAVNVHSGT